tara:strand:- start:95 stop:703 length:609 start_codon:yes stop_codon:yes gene_type:complete
MANVIKGHLCFPTIVFEFELDIPVHDRIHMLKYINKFGRQGEINLAQTPDDIHELSYFKHFKDNILKLHKEILEKLKYEYEDIVITNMWGNKLMPEGIHPPHTHSNNLFSGVFYLQTDLVSSNIQFFDPRPQSTVMVPRRKENTHENSDVMSFTTKQNTGYIFPSWLQHWVPPTGSERISLSWNIMIKGNYGEPKSLQNAYI